MSGTFFGFNTALKGLFAQQKAMNTTSHNIANADTPGYTRQQAVMAADFAFPVPSMNRPGGAGQVGTGVNVTEVRRIRDLFLDKQIRTELSSLGQWEQKAETLKLAETVFIEPSDDGLSSIFNEFWKAWQELSKNAENMPIRTSLVETAVSLADALKHAHSQLTTVVGDLEFIAETKALQVNTLATQVDDLNQQIAAIQLAGDSPNDLKDKRDLLLDELAGLVNFTTEETTVTRPIGYAKEPDGEGNMVTKVVMGEVPDGQIRIYIGNESDPNARDSDHYLVHVNGKFGNETVENTNKIAFDADETPPIFKWSKESDPATEPPTYVFGDVVSFSNGQLLGILEVTDQVEEYIADLNTLAKDLATEINTKHMQGFDLDGVSGLDFFIIDPANAASSIQVNSEIVKDVKKIAASAGDGDPDKIDHNGSIALKIAKLRPNTDRQYDQLVSRIGVKTNEAARRTDGQDVLVGQLEARREEMSGVSLDEEMAMMLQYQRIYQASATMINTLDEMVQTILAMKR